MGATNHTTYYELSQFIGTDKPAWLQDYNGDMTKIDAGIKEAKNAADDADTAASNAQGDATDALNAIETINTTLGTIEDTLGTATGNISTINSLIGNGTPTTSDQTIIGAINGIEGAIAPREDGDDLANSYAIGEQFARGGSAYTALTPLTAGTAFASLTLNTDYKVSDTLTEQIAGVIENIPELPEGRILVTTRGISVNTDGVKTNAELYKELADALVSYAQNLPDGAYGEVHSLTSDQGALLVKGVLPNITNAATSTRMEFSGFTIDAANAGAERCINQHVQISTTAGDCISNQIISKVDGTITYSSRGATVPAVGGTYIVYVREYVPTH